MSNVNAPYGFKPKGKPLRQNKYKSAGAIYAGDMCLSPSAGVVAAATGGESAILCLGAALHSVSASGMDVIVADHPDQLYSVQAASVASSDVGSYAKVSAGATNAFTESRQGISAVATTVTLPLQIQGLDGNIKNEFGSNARAIVRINTYGA